MLSEAREEREVVREGAGLATEGPWDMRVEVVVEGVGARLATERVERRLLALGAAMDSRGAMGLIFGAWFLVSAGFALAKLIRALLVAVGLTTGAVLTRTGRALNVFFWASASASFLRPSSRCSFSLREMASPGSSKEGRVGGFEDLVGWKGAFWRELTRAWVVVGVFAGPNVVEVLELAVVFVTDVLETLTLASVFLVASCAERVVEHCLGFVTVFLRTTLAALFFEAATLLPLEGFRPVAVAGLLAVLPATALWSVFGSSVGN